MNNIYTMKYLKLSILKMIVQRNVFLEILILIHIISNINFFNNINFKILNNIIYFDKISNLVNNYF